MEGLSTDASGLWYPFACRTARIRPPAAADLHSGDQIEHRARHNISFDETVKLVGLDTAEKLCELTLRIYSLAVQHANARGVIIADTKFEFGLVDGKIVLADEVLTPDSSRFWPAESYRPGGPQLSYDKQFVRDYLESIRWDKNPPAPSLPDDIVRKTREKYIQAYRQLSGKELEL